MDANDSDRPASSTSTGKERVVLYLSLVVLLGALSIRLFHLEMGMREYASVLADVRLAGAERSALVDGFIGVLNRDHVEFQAFNGRDARSQEATGIAADGGLVVYVFATNCAFSPGNFPRLAALQGLGANVVGIAPQESHGAVGAYVRGHAVDFPVLTDVEQSEIAWLPTEYLPLTMVISPEGIVEGLWLGDLRDDRMDHVREVVEEMMR
jgi:hypothetical protein